MTRRGYKIKWSELTAEERIRIIESRRHMADTTEIRSFRRACRGLGALRKRQKAQREAVIAFMKKKRAANAA